VQSEQDDAQSQVVVAKLRSDGSLDPAFASAGVYLPEIPGSASSLRVAATGEIVLLSHQAVVRLRTDGTPDASFSEDGIATVDPDVGRTSAATLTPDGSIYVAGPTSDRLFDVDSTLVRLTAQGEVDTTFGDHGVVRLAPTGLREERRIQGVELDPMGNAVVAVEYCFAYHTGPSGGMRNCDTQLISVSPAGESNAAPGSVFAGNDSAFAASGASGLAALAGLNDPPGYGYPAALSVSAFSLATGTLRTDFGTRGTAYIYRRLAGGTADALATTLDGGVAGIFVDSSERRRLVRLEGEGERRDADADGVPDARDDCELFSGDRRRGCPPVSRTLGLARNTDSGGVRARIGSPFRACREGQVVHLFRRVQGPDKELSAESTSRHGSALFSVVRGRRGIYAHVDRSKEEPFGFCRAARSSSLRVR
jgi:uncharacterized delta-60 repeat protein